MKKIHKIILVISVVSVLFVALAFPISASGGNSATSNNIRIPYLNPNIMIVDSNTTSVDKSLVFDSNLTFPIPTNLSGTYLYNAVTQVNDSTLLASAVVNRSSGDKFLYGVNSNTGDFALDFDLPDGKYDGCNLYLTFDSFALPEELALSKNEFAYNSLGTFYIRRDVADDTSQYYINASAYSFSCEFAFVDKEGKVQTVTRSKSISLSQFYYSKYFLEELRLIVDEYADVIDSDVLVKYIIVSAQNIAFLDSLYIYGGTRWIDYSRNDIYNLLRSWEPKKIINTPTIVESITTGVNAIWDMRIFNTFTIGQIFGACIGLLMFRWFLKMFAGG